MNNFRFILTIFSFSIFFMLSHEIIAQSADSKPSRPDYVLVIHGGAGTMQSGLLTDEALYREGLSKALQAGETVLNSGGSAIDAVVAAIIILEDDPLFNAGKGGVYNEAGEVAHDASLMEGKDGKAGAVGMIRHIQNPILAAKAVMDEGRHVFMVGEGAEAFAEKAGLKIVEQSYFFNQDRWDDYEKTRNSRLEDEFPVDSKGTVGAVALDRDGNLAAGTSTGGMHFKRIGRLGDSPVIGAGTWADNQSCAVSATGHGEYFIRNAVASDISARMKYLNETLEQAAQTVVMEKLKNIGAGGGIIALDKNGNITMPFNTSGMFRAYVKAGENPVIAIFKDK
jgi:beta-aspartyl-peptidase (threonine type)